MEEKYFNLIVRVSDRMLDELHRELDGEGTDEQAVAEAVARTGIIVVEIEGTE